MPHVRVLRPFNNGSHHAFVQLGDVIMVTDERATDLMRNHLVELATGEKAASIPENKAAPAPLNKAITSDTIAPPRRGPGRPAKIR
ncbi:hypothetical protein [Methylobacterium brachiatum]|uniref:hypothetical protein n=1 Tax=Methylobacterium brachiatum TaxID=269660 RepID=UPI00244970DD|nr:hypothetical protein [Methylobacterium brachiatum]MDH2313996.1 hypothetical protein [Methylobacterium brachiatum]